MTNARTVNARPTAEQVLNPQAAREEAIRSIFREQHKHLAALFARDGATMVARALSSAIQALKMRDPKTGALTLEKVSPETIAEKCIACHHMGLEPVTEAYLIPYGPTLQIIAAPRGLIKLMANAGWRVEARAVRDGDLFEHDLGDDGYIRHRKLDGRREGGVTFGYAFAKHKDGGPVIREVLSRDDIEAYRAQSKQPNGPMWSDNFEGAVRKTMIHRIAEFIPLPSEVRAVMRQNEAGGMEIPDEVWAGVVASMKQKASGAAPIVEQVPANGEAREPVAED